MSDVFPRVTLKWEEKFRDFPELNTNYIYVNSKDILLYLKYKYSNIIYLNNKLYIIL